MEPNKWYTNTKLAGLYFNMAIEGTTLTSMAAQIRERIESADVNIAEYFHTHGSLKELGIRGIGRKTIDLLEGILDPVEIDDFNNIPEFDPWN